MHIVALALGAGSLAVGILVRITPLRWAKPLGDSESEDAKVWRHSFGSHDGSLSLQKQTSKALLSDHQIEKEE